MITTNKLLIFFIASLVMAASAHATNPREELKQLTAQLQSNPSDTALREKIIKLARTIRPAPAIPVEAERFDGRGEYAFKSAKSEADYLVAAQEFEKASNAAPWIASYYYNLGTAYEKAQRPNEAKRNFELYLLAAPDARDAREVSRRISGLEFAIEKAAAEKRALNVELEKRRIVPGQRIGPVYLDMETQALMQAMGSPKEKVRYNDGSGYLYKWESLGVITTNPSGRVTKIFTENTMYAMEDGSVVGMPTHEFLSKRPSPTLRVDHQPGLHAYCFSDGLRVESRNEKIAAITVWSPGCGERTGHYKVYYLDSSGDIIADGVYRKQN